MTNYVYAWRNGSRWIAWFLRDRNVIGAIRQAWLAYVCGYIGETCERCGRRMFMLGLYPGLKRLDRQTGLQYSVTSICENGSIARVVPTATTTCRQWRSPLVHGVVRVAVG